MNIVQLSAVLKQILTFITITSSNKNFKKYETGLEVALKNTRPGPHHLKAETTSSNSRLQKIGLESTTVKWVRWPNVIFFWPS